VSGKLTTALESLSEVVTSVKKEHAEYYSKQSEHVPVGLELLRENLSFKRCYDQNI
jgi:hypothetical protein